MVRGGTKSVITVHHGSQRWLHIKITWGAFLKYHPQRFFAAVPMEALGTSASYKSLGEFYRAAKLENGCWKPEPQGLQHALGLIPTWKGKKITGCWSHLLSPCSCFKHRSGPLPPCWVYSQKSFLRAPALWETSLLVKLAAAHNFFQNLPASTYLLTIFEHQWNHGFLHCNCELENYELAKEKTPREEIEYLVCVRHCI